MGACTITNPTLGVIPQNLGHLYWVGGPTTFFTVALSSSYAAGGDTFTPAQVGLGSAIAAMIVSTSAASQTTFWYYVLNNTSPGSPTIQAFTAAAVPGPTVALVEVTAGTNLSGVTFNAVFIGV